MTVAETTAIRSAMIDAASAARINTSAWVASYPLEIIKALSPLVGGWLPEDVTIDASGNVTVHPRSR